MARSQCPGQDRRFWKSDDTSEEPCPHCGEMIEFWKDDFRRRCKHCGQLVSNPHFDMGCAKWCQFAEQCVGIPATQVRDETLCHTLIKEMKTVFGDDERRVRHALTVLDYAEQILKQEKADPLVVKAAAVLHDIGIHQAEAKHGSPAAKYQEIEGPPIARGIMKELGIDEMIIDHVCRIIANHHSARDIDTPEFRIVWDADWLVNLPDEYRDLSRLRLENMIDRMFKTATGVNLAKSLYLAGS